MAGPGSGSGCGSAAGHHKARQRRPTAGVLAQLPRVAAGDRKRASDWCFPGDRLPELGELVRRRARSRLACAREAGGAPRRRWRVGRLRTLQGCVAQAAPSLPGALSESRRVVECDLPVCRLVTRDLVCPGHSSWHLLRNPDLADGVALRVSLVWTRVSVRQVFSISEPLPCLVCTVFRGLGILF